MTFKDCSCSRHLIKALHHKVQAIVTSVKARAKPTVLFNNFAGITWSANRKTQESRFFGMPQFCL